MLGEEGGPQQQLITNMIKLIMYNTAMAISQWLMGVKEQGTTYGSWIGKQSSPVRDL